MREDMKHVIIDRPRKGGEGGKSRPPKGSMRFWQRMPAEDYPKSESTARGRRYGWDCKQLNERLSPLRRWLRSNCGRSWDSVFSEICEGLRVRNATAAHVRDHAEQFVLQNTRLMLGVVCDSKGDPINKSGWRWYPFYVDPGTGILREAPKWKRQRRRPKAKVYAKNKRQLGKKEIKKFQLWETRDMAVQA